MLRTLTIKNYALIDNLQVTFNNGLTAITGETGAGKSILLGGLSLVLGKRADLNSIKNSEEKCIIEAGFAIENYQLQPFFIETDLDYEPHTIIRREILPSGKSRAFINDTPVTLDVLSSLGERLIDIHSQHQTLRLTDNSFQFQVIDGVAENTNFLNDYAEKLSHYLQTKKELKNLINFQQEADKEYDYNSFLLQELQSANLQVGMMEELEETYERLNNVEEIGGSVSHVLQILGEEQVGTLAGLSELKTIFYKLSNFGPSYKELHTRIQSALIELDDIHAEIQRMEENLEADPQLLEEVNAKLQQIYALQKKHNVLEIKDLLLVQDELAQSVSKTENLENEIKEKQLDVMRQEEALDALAQKIHKAREAAIPTLTAHLEAVLAELGMPDAQFKISVNMTGTYFSNGKDELHFLFSANKGSSFNELKKVASGGELSRIMLAIKSLLAQYMHLPTIMFDEIDTGVSGEVSNKMGDIMHQMSKTMQVFTITHLPQVAAKGDAQFKVFKEDSHGVTSSQMKLLTPQERIHEIAEMLGGKDISASAMAHAKELLLKKA
ncbi:DNA repair protein RecN [Galbibacter pacificus]|uniref:DNA repair protein RecN n=1 Tax=Galbibacter pacificus TaxID=2996052 RepID=A0ABT6FRE9_9FLAO|nr:DNA repair protein RecN [Galbibacter pacificus]MDG3581685.1 DNA repair protein RecN [Galbibacter pacificus]MDG3585841.1 DNA repair protein RecN [Galbibacter pacificus]